MLDCSTQRHPRSGARPGTVRGRVLEPALPAARIRANGVAGRGALRVWKPERVARGGGSGRVTSEQRPPVPPGPRLVPDLVARGERGLAGDRLQLLAP
jgi:hypothetical protein